MARRPAVVDPAQASLFDVAGDETGGRFGQGFGADPGGESNGGADAAQTVNTALHIDLLRSDTVDEEELVVPPLGAPPMEAVRYGPTLARPSSGSRPGGSPRAPDVDTSSRASAEDVPASLQSVLAPTVFIHPQAERRISLGGHVVGYALRCAKRRSIGFIVGAEGLSVNAPKWVGVREIEQALQAKSAWIIRKLAEQQERIRRLDEKRIEWRDGAAFPFLGETVIVVLDPRAGNAPGAAMLNTDATALPGVPRLTLHVALAHTATPAQIRDAVQSWLQRQAKRIFEERCNAFAPRLGVRVKRLALSSAQTRWGSASANGDIRLHWRLVHFAMSTIDYVVAHELAHLREMNHSAKFWDVVRSVVPDYEQVRRTLKSDTLPALD